MKGRIHSYETFGTVDGPGVRFVLFLQGCVMRCLYCHNPDTWEIDAGKVVTPEEVIAEFKKNKEFYKSGGITVTGGEPLLQIDFVTELFSLARKEGIHTCLDTSGITFSPERKEIFEELLKHTSLCMLDIKHIDNEKHKALTGHGNKNILEFALFVSEKGVPLWIRHIILDGYTDGEKDLLALGEFIGTLGSLRAIDVLPYHTMGVHKYKELSIPYKLEGVLPTSLEKAAGCKEIILEGIRKTRNKKRPI